MTNKYINPNDWPETVQVIRDLILDAKMRGVKPIAKYADLPAADKQNLLLAQVEDLSHINQYCIAHDKNNKNNFYTKLILLCQGFNKADEIKVAFLKTVEDNNKERISDLLDQIVNERKKEESYISYDEIVERLARSKKTEDEELWDEFVAKQAEELNKEIKAYWNNRY